jgi:surfeit locus 1 family protein
VKALLGPRWITAHVVVVVVVVVFVNLGFWQLRRLEERRTTNAVGEARFQAAPGDLDTLLQAAGADVASLEFRRARVTGVFQPDHEVLIRSQVHQGAAGFHVITPLLEEDGAAVLVNRGWVPLGLDQVPVTEALPPEGTVTIEGWVRPTQLRPSLGPEDPEEGRLVAMNRVDIARIQQQVPFRLQEVYLSLLGEQSEGQPLLADPPAFDDQGSHLAYAIQWFGFTLIGLLGYLALVRKTVRRSSR